MGSTLEHGIYLPSEGEKNCYQGLAGNWNKVDGALGDIAELKQSIESKFTKEIVTELPTEDINPFCIYMILKTDPETDNIYDEWVYINNSWEYLGNTKVDMTQYYTKQEVNQLPAVASGVTATKVGNYDAHIANGDIHVTASDKAKWDTVALIKQLRLVNTQVGSATTIAFANIDDTNGIKVGDKCMDLDAKMFEITAVDTTNETVTVGSALIDLALDANVVHTNRNDDVSIPLNSTSAELGVTGGSTNITFLDKNDKKLSGLTLGNYGSSKLSYARLNIFDKDTNNNEIQDSLEYAYVSNNNNAYLRVSRDNFCALGTTSYRWKGVYAQSYYYGSDNVEFSTKFVTTDTAQTIYELKTFSKGLRIYNTNTSDNTSSITLRTSKVLRGSTTDGGDSLGVMFNDRGDSLLSSVRCTKVSNGTTQLRNIVNTTDPSDNIITCETQLNIAKNGDKSFIPSEDSQINLGSSSYRWKSFNGLTPSSLGMPTDNIANIIDISGYLTVLDGSQANTYQAPDNGYIGITMSNCTGIQAYITGFWGHQVVRPTAGALRFFMPICKNMTANILVFGGTVDNARFFPCQGNI